MTEVTSPPRLRVLHVILMLGPTNGQYNEHCLPMVGQRDLSIVTYFVPRLTPPTEIAVYAGDGSLRGFFRALRRALESERYDVIHAHAPESGVLLLAALAIRRRLGSVGRSLVYTVQDSFHDYRLRNQALMLFAFPFYRRVVFCSYAARASFPRPWLWLVGGRGRVVPNAADLDRVERAIEGAPARGPGPFTVVSVGRLEPVKDPDVVVAAFRGATDDDDRLVIVGTGSMHAAVAARAAALGVADRVRFTGLIDRDEVFRECAAADVFISTSRGEGLPVAPIEAMAAGCPIVLSDIPPHRELADGADLIPLIEPGDVEGFAAAIRRYREMTLAERLDIGRRGREHVAARYGLALMHERIAKVYGEVIARDRGAVPA